MNFVKPHSGKGQAIASVDQKVEHSFRTFIASARTDRVNKRAEDLAPHQGVTKAIHRSPEEFIHEALRIGHPAEVNALFPSCVGQAVDKALSGSHEALAKNGTAELRRWASLVEEFQYRELAVRKDMSKRRSTVLQEKKGWLG